MKTTESFELFLKMLLELSKIEKKEWFDRYAPGFGFSCNTPFKVIGETRDGGIDGNISVKQLYLTIKKDPNYKEIIHIYSDVTGVSHDNEECRLRLNLDGENVQLIGLPGVSRTEEVYKGRVIKTPSGRVIKEPGDVEIFCSLSPNCGEYEMNVCERIKAIAQKYFIKS